MKINVSDLEAGMIIGRDVENFRGDLLLKRGVPLNDRFINILKKWGIPVVEIESEYSQNEEPNKNIPDSVFVEVDTFLSQIEEKASSVQLEIKRVARNLLVEKWKRENQ